MANCLDADAALDLLENRLSGDARAVAESHVDECAGCRQFLAALVRSESTSGDSGDGAAVAGAAFRSGERVGRYVLIELAGVGGMGVVYAAYDPELDRKVALKLVHRRVQSNAQRERLRREAQAMAKVHHPNVAQVFDVGTHAGEVFVAMEFVAGTTLTEWMAGATHSWQEVVDVFTLAGRGLLAAHCAELVHRDFKPDNVLLSTGDGRVCVSDFGLVARHSESEELAELDLSALDAGMPTAALTRTGAVVGTPAYMAPEHIQGRAADARSDQFSFCVALYEALYGQRPFAGKSVREICSNALAGHLSDDGGLPARGVPARLLGVILKGLSAEPTERYESMDELLRALGALRTRKRRRTMVLGVGAVAIVALLVWLTAASSGENETVCGGAEHALASAWGPQQRSTLEASLGGGDVATRVLAGLDAYAHLWQSEHKEACQATRVHKHQSEKDLGRRMSCLAGIRVRMGAFVREVTVTDNSGDRALVSMGALPAPKDCADLSTLAIDDGAEKTPEYIELEGELASLQAKMQLGQAADGLSFAKALLPRLETFAEPGLLAKGRSQMASLLQASGELVASREMYGSALKVAVVAGNEALVASLWISLVHLVGHDLREPVDAEVLIGVAELALARVPSPTRLALRLRGVLAMLASSAGDLSRAEAEFRAVAEGFEASAGAFHPRTLNAMHNLGDVLRRAGKTEEARSIWSELLAAQEERFGPNHSTVASTRMQLGHDAYQQGQLEQALEHYRSVLAIRIPTLGTDAPKVAAAHAALGLALRASGDTQSARTHQSEALAIWKRALGPKHPDVALALNNLASTAYSEGNLEEARDLYQEAYELKKAALGAKHIGVTAPLFNLALVLSESGGGCSEAEPLWREVLEIREQHLAPDHPHMAFPLTSLGDCLVADAAFSKAVPMLERALAIRVKHGTTPSVTAETQFALAQALVGKNRRRALELAKAARMAILDMSTQIEFAGRIDAWIASRELR